MSNPTASTFLEILQIALIGLQAVPGAAPEAALVSVLLPIIQKAISGYQAASSQPLDLTKIPLETPVV